jgi:hypothetical protein
MAKLQGRSYLPLFLVVSALFACKKSGPAAAEQTGSATPASEVPSGVTFAKALPAVGTKRQESSRNDLDFSIDFKRAGNRITGGHFKKSAGEKRRVEVLATNATSVTKIRVTYDEKYDGESRGTAEPKKRPSPVAGKTYVVDSSSGKIEVRGENDARVPKRESDIVAKDWKSLGKPDKMAALIPDRPLAEGEKLPVSADLVRDLFNADDGDETSVDNASFTFRGTKQEGAVRYGQFDVTFKISMTSKKQDIAMTLDLAGKLAVDTATSQLGEITLKGPLSMKGISKSAHGELEGSGTMNASMSSKPE